MMSPSTMRHKMIALILSHPGTSTRNSMSLYFLLNTEWTALPIRMTIATMAPQPQASMLSIFTSFTRW